MYAIIGNNTRTRHIHTLSLGRNMCTPCFHKVRTRSTP